MDKVRLEEGFLLENGQRLEEVEVAYQTYGKLNTERSNVVWVCHALTANANVLEWWNPLFEGNNTAFPLEDYFVVCVNMLGSCYGTTGPLSKNPMTSEPYFHDFPCFTIRDIVKIHQAVAADLNINRIQFLIGASMGGHQAMEWAIEEAQRFDNLILIATNAKHSSWGIAFNESQRMAIELDPTWNKQCSIAGLEGLKTARSMALLSYRSYDAYVNSQVDSADILDNFKASGYQRYQGDKLSRRFNAYSYYRLSQAMDSHHVGRGRGGIAIALSRIQAKSLIIGFNSDLLFPPKEQRYLARNILHAQLKILHSDYGHDGFLVEAEKIAQLINELIKQQLTSSFKK